MRMCGGGQESKESILFRRFVSTTTSQKTTPNGWGFYILMGDELPWGEINFSPLVYYQVWARWHQHPQNNARYSANLLLLSLHDSRVPCIHLLVGGFNPFEKYESNWKSSPIFGMKIPKIFELPPARKYSINPKPKLFRHFGGIPWSLNPLSGVPKLFFFVEKTLQLFPRKKNLSSPRNILGKLV